MLRRHEKHRLAPSTSFRGRITAAILLTTITVLLFGCVLFMVEQQRMDRQNVLVHESRFATFLARASAGPMSAGDAAGVRNLVAAAASFPGLSTAEVRNSDGAVLASYSRSRRLRGTVLAARAPIMSGDRRIGEVTLRRNPPAPALVAPRYVAMGGALFFAAIALALFLGRWLAGRISEPVARLSTVMEEVGRNGDFARRVEPTADDELGQLTESFNGLLATLNQNDQALRRTVSELMTARDAAEAANVQKSQFLANMSHEIRTPLNGVLAMAQILARSGLGAAQGEQVEVIRTSGEALLEILNDILDVSKIEAGKFELDVAEFDLEEVANAVHAGLAAIAERKSLDFTVHVAPEARGVRLGDAIRLRQILNNFVSNALKFTDHGEVSLTVEGEGPAGETGLHVIVADTGVGIDPAKHSLLFQKFSQLDASATRRFSGTGLGLAICHDLAELMGGHVWVESAPARGSTFHAVLRAPRVRAAAVPGPPGSAEPSLETHDSDPATDISSGAGLRVLAAEDNPVNQLVLSTVMQIFGVELAIVGNGREAVETWGREAFDLILMDIQMPVMDGMSATAAIRAAEVATGRSRTPIVALSANALPHQVAEYLAVGMDSHVAKPIEIAKLQIALEAVLASDAEIAA